MIGFGYDLHKLEKGESLILGGVHIDSPVGTVAHSDGDVLLHSIIDAILGAAGLGDIGDHFPDYELEHKDADSTVLLYNVLQMIGGKFVIINVDATIVLEEPKLYNYKKEISNNLKKLLGIERVNIKATTNEKMGEVGTGKAIIVYSVCQLENK